MAKKDELLRTASTPRRSERKHTTHNTHNTPMAPAFGRHCVGTDADPSKRTAPSRSKETRAEPCARRYGRHPLRPFRLGPAVPGRGRLSEPPMPLEKSAKQRHWHAESTFGRRKGCRSPVLHFAAHTVFVEDLRPRPLAAQKDHDESGAARVRKPRHSPHAAPRLPNPIMKEPARGLTDRNAAAARLAQMTALRRKGVAGTQVIDSRRVPSRRKPLSPRTTMPRPNRGKRVRMEKRRSMRYRGVHHS